MPKPNVIMITVDCLRAHHLKCMGYHRDTSPNLDQLASDGALFSQCFSNGPATPSSFSSILTSTYPLMYGGYKYLLEKRTTIAEALQKAGYTTVGFHSNPFLLSKRNFGKGFELFEDFEGKVSSATFLLQRIVKSIVNEESSVYNFLAKAFHLYLSPSLSVGYAKAERINKRVFSWLANDPENFFLWVHYMDVHYPFLPPRLYFKEFHCKDISDKEIKRILSKMREKPNSITSDELEVLIDLYDGEIKYVDYHIGDLIKYLNKKRILQNSLIIVTADHGVEFFEHGGVGISTPDSGKLYDELLHVPLIILGKDIEKGVNIRSQVSLIDLAPTVLDFLKIPKPEIFMGSSLLPLIEGKDDGDRCVISETMARIAYREDGWKYILNREKNTEELYNLNTDPRETVNLSTVNVTKLKNFWAKVGNHISIIEKEQICASEIKLEKEIKERLRKLGYID